MVFINLVDLNYVINNFNKEINLDVNINTIHSNEIVTNDISTSNIINEINNIQNEIDDISSSNTNKFTDNIAKLDKIKFSELYYDISQIYTSISQLDISLANDYYKKNLIDDSFNNINIKINNIINNDTSFNGQITFNDDVTISGNLIGPHEFYIDPIPNDNSGTLIINGNLQVDGSMTIINSNTIDISNKTIILAKDLNISSLNGAGIEIDNSNGDNPSILYNNDKWNINTNVDISKKLNVKDNDFSFKINDNNDNKKVEIKTTTNNKNVYIDGNLEISGNMNGTILSDILKNIPNEYNNIKVIDSINTNNIYSNNIITNKIDTSSIHIKNLIINSNDLSLNIYSNHPTTPLPNYIDISGTIYHTFGKISVVH